MQLGTLTRVALSHFAVAIALVVLVIALVVSFAASIAALPAMWLKYIRGGYAP